MRVREAQADLRETLRAGPESLGKRLRARLRLGLGTRIEAPPMPRIRLTVAEYRDPPIELEEEIGRAWRGRVRAEVAAQPLFWMLCHIAWIENGCLGASGFELEQALLLGGKRGPELRTRTFLRRTGGLAVVRGNVSVYSDCPLARAWWRYELARQVACATSGSDAAISRKAAHAALHASKSAWEQLVMLSLRRLTVINQVRARAQIVRHLHGVLREEGRIRKTHVSEAAVRLARLALRRSLASTPWNKLDEIMPKRSDSASAAE